MRIFNTTNDPELELIAILDSSLLVHDKKRQDSLDGPSFIRYSSYDKKKRIFSGLYRFIFHYIIQQVIFRLRKFIERSSLISLQPVCDLRDRPVYNQNFIPTKLSGRENIHHQPDSD